MRISDWSSDVCSSDLSGPAGIQCAERRLCAAEPASRQARIRCRRAGQSHLRKCGTAYAAVAVPVDGRHGDPGRAADRGEFRLAGTGRSEEHTSELQSLMRISYAVFCLKQKNTKD